MRAITKGFLNDWKFVLPPQDTRLPRVTIALGKLKRILGEVDGHPPKRTDLQNSFHKLLNTWRGTRSLNAIPGRVLKDFPWAAFQPWAREGDDLPNDHQFILAYQQWLLENPSGRRTARLIPPHLRYFPDDEDFREVWRRILVDIIDSDPPRPRLSLWRERNEKFRILSRNGPEELAETLLKRPTEYEEVLKEAGLTGFLSDSAFVRATFRSLIAQISRRLQNDSRISKDECTALLSMLEVKPGTLRFDDTRIKIAEALLTPWLTASPPEAVRASVRPFLQRVLGNPNIRRGDWAGISANLKQVFLRWLAEETLDTFFQILSQTALDRHWQERKAFWKRYLDAGFISDAWLALGPDAAHMVETHFQVPAGSWAKLSGSQSSQSVLLFRIQNLTVKEWSHSGAGRIWLDGSRTAPQLYRARYSGSGLRTDCDYRFRHAGNWHWETETWIRRQTGIRPRRT